MSSPDREDHFRCPQCGLSDRVEKASVSKISPPSPYNYGTTWAYENPWGGCSISFVSVSFVAFLFFFIVFLANAGSPIGNPQAVLPLLLVTLVLAIIAVFITIHHVREAKSSQAAVAHHNAELPAQNDAGQKRYIHEQRIFDQLYYCGRNDVVFIPGKPQICVPASEVQRLYETDQLIMGQ